MAHPFLALNVIVKGVRDHLWPIVTVALVVLGLGIGCYFYKPLSWLSTIVVPLAGGVLATALTGLILIPLVPWFLIGLVVLFIVLFLYEWKVNKTFAGAVQGVEEDLGIKSKSAPVSPATGAVQVQVNHA